ncbi:unnamed protein product [marine sediment metagenome]|uniref:Uncharacterized protein n=1 Tax=marine sediment metagenome TaxID=412755 RepID=X1V2N9_9ZZZZ
MTIPVPVVGTLAGYDKGPVADITPGGVSPLEDGEEAELGLVGLGRISSKNIP